MNKTILPGPSPVATTASLDVFPLIQDSEQIPQSSLASAFVQVPGNVMAVDKSKVIDEFNRVFGWSFPVDAHAETLAAMSEYSALRSRKDLADKINQLINK